MLRNALGDEWFLLSYSTEIKVNLIEIRIKLRLGLSFMFLCDSIGV